MKRQMRTTTTMKTVNNLNQTKLPTVRLSPLPRRWLMIDPNSILARTRLQRTSASRAFIKA